jgi:hypothetical protein
MGRGRQSDGVDVPASEMKKWYAIYDVHHGTIKLIPLSFFGFQV